MKNLFLMIGPPKVPLYSARCEGLKDVAGWVSAVMVLFLK